MPFLFLFLAALCGRPAHAGSTLLDGTGLVLDRWTRADGLPLDHVTDVALTDDGRVWVATFAGVLAFDGHAFHPLPAAHAAALGSPRTYALAVHPDDGALWMITEAGRVARLHRGELAVWGADGALGVDELRFAEEADALWLTTGAGLWRLTDRPERGPVPDRVAGVARTADGTLWVGLRDGRVRRFLDGAELPALDGRHGLPGPLFALVGLDRGGLWVFGEGMGPDAGYAWDGQAFVPSPGGTEGPDACGGTWIVGAACAPEHGRGGPWRVGPRAVLRHGEVVLALDHPTRSAVQDPRGDVWIATRGDGLLRLREATANVVRPGGTDPRVDMVWVEGPEAWVRVTTGAWWRVQPEAPRPLEAVLHTGEAVIGPRYLLRAPDGTLVGEAIGGPVALDALDPTAPVRARRESTVRVHGARGSAVDVAGRTWLATQSGVRVREAGGWRAVDHSVLGDPAGVVPHPDGGMVVALREVGLARVWADGRVERAPPHPGVQWARSLGRSGHAVRVGTEASGICVVPDIREPPASWTVRCLTEREGLPAAGAHAAVDDARGRTWISTNGGIAVLPTAALRAFAAGGVDLAPPLVLDGSDGLADPEGNGGSDLAMRLADDGTLWVATQDGAARIDTAAFALPEPPVVRLGATTVGGEAVDDLGALPSDHGTIALAWTAPSRRWADQVAFRTRLAGRPWSTPSAARALTLAELPAGAGAVEIQAGLAGAWGPVASLPFRRAYRPSEHPAAPFGAAAVTALLVGALVRRRQRVLQERAAALEVQVDARTRELSEQAVELARQADRIAAQAEELEGLDALKTRMIVNLHHELRTPLSLVLGPLRDASTGSTDQLPLALRNAEHLEHLVEQLSDIAHLEAGSTRLMVRHTDLGRFARRCAERFLPLARRQRQRLTCVAPAEPVAAFVDPELLEKALGNLVHNALKFTPAGGSVEVAVVRDAGWARLEVRDTGPGVPEHERERIFERLYQVHRSDDRPHEGSGLGLALVREVVDLHGGEVAVRPRDGGGSVFGIALSLGTSHLSPDDVSVAPDAVACDVPDARDAAEGPTVLVVEDHPDMRAYLRASLADGYTVITAANGREGLAHARTHRPAVIVSDVMMPDMDGIAMARALRAEPALRDIPIVLVTAKTRPEDRVEGLEVADAWLGKPFHVPELRAHVRRLAGRGSPPSAEAPTMAVADRELLARLAAILDDRLDDDALRVEHLARGVAMAERTLQRELARILGISPTTWMRERRLEAARGMLREGRYRTVGEVAAAVGMSRSYFSRTYRAWCGHSPKDDAR